MIVRDEFKDSICNLIKGGLIIEVTTEEEAIIAEQAGAKAIVVVDWDEQLKETGFMPDIYIIEQIKASVSIPIFVRIVSGQFVEAKLVEKLQLAGIDEVVAASNNTSLYKRTFSIPFINEYDNFETAIHQMVQGSVMIKNKDNSCIHTIASQLNNLRRQVKYLTTLTEEEIAEEANNRNSHLDMLLHIRESELPALLVAHGLIRNPTEVAFLMRSGADALMIKYSVFKEMKVERLLKTLVEAVNQYENDEEILRLQKSISPLNEKACVYKR